VPLTTPSANSPASEPGRLGPGSPRFSTREALKGLTQESTVISEDLSKDSMHASQTTVGAMNELYLALAAFIAVAGLILVFSFGLFFFRPWVRALMSGAPVSILSILTMRLRGTPAPLLIDAYIQLRHRGSTATLADVEKQYIANRQRVRNVGDLIDFVERDAGKVPQGST
jgi:hypothetical protein